MNKRKKSNKGGSVNKKPRAKPESVLDGEGKTLIPCPADTPFYAHCAKNTTEHAKVGEFLETAMSFMDDYGDSGVGIDKCSCTISFGPIDGVVIEYEPRLYKVASAPGTDAAASSASASSTSDSSTPAEASDAGPDLASPKGSGRSRKAAGKKASGGKAAAGKASGNKAPGKPRLVLKVA